MSATIQELAASWALREDTLKPAERAELELWLDTPAHQHAYDNARHALGLARNYAAAPEVMELREAALAARPVGNVALRRLALGMAAGIAAIIVAAGISAWRDQPRDVAVTTPVDPNTASHQTVVGERSAIALPDGSTVTLDTDSAVRVAYTADERRLYLTRGQALFDVAKNEHVPFQVYVGDRRITAVGTLFNVRLDGAKVKVALLEGVVRVAPIVPKPEIPAQLVTMKAGDVLEAAPTAAMSVKPANPTGQASWKDGVVVFEDAQLADAVAEINRYTARPIAIADPSLGALRVSGVFKTGDPARFAEQMREVFPIAIERTPDGVTTMRRRQ